MKKINRVKVDVVCKGRMSLGATKIVQERKIRDPEKLEIYMTSLQPDGEDKDI